MESTQSGDSALIRELSLPLSQSKGWMKLLGVLLIINGILTALSIVGLVIAWLPIWLGVLLFQSASAAEQAQLAGHKEAMLDALGKLRTYFTIMGILMLIVVVLTGFAMIGGMVGGLMGLGEMQQFQHMQGMGGFR